MTYQNLRKKTEGFTIIEVLIVLAIAGLIMLIVFLAVPALQRNQRNTAARTEASRILTAANDFVTNSNGTYPVAADNTAIMNIVGTTKQLTTLSVVTANGDATANSARLMRGTCSGATATYSASARTFALQFALEPNATQACIES